MWYTPVGTTQTHPRSIHPEYSSSQQQQIAAAVSSSSKTGMSIRAVAVVTRQCSAQGDMSKTLTVEEHHLVHVWPLNTKQHILTSFKTLLLSCCLVWKAMHTMVKHSLQGLLTKSSILPSAAGPKPGAMTYKGGW
jgi:hypothetical protein